MLSVQCTRSVSISIITKLFAIVLAFGGPLLIWALLPVLDDMIEFKLAESVLSVLIPFLFAWARERRVHMMQVTAPTNESRTAIRTRAGFLAVNAVCLPTFWLCIQQMQNDSYANRSFVPLVGTCAEG